MWPKRQQQQTLALPDSPQEYPSGSFVRTEKGYFFISGPGKRLRIISLRVLSSWAPQRVIKTTEAAVKNYRITSKIKFRNGSLIWNLADGKMYLVESGYRRHVTSPEALQKIGAWPEKPMIVSEDEINLHPEGEPLN